MAGAADIVGVDINESKFELAKTFGADFCLNPLKAQYIYEDSKTLTTL